MTETRDHVLKLIDSNRALSAMERDLHAFLAESRMHATVTLGVPPEIYTPTETSFLESDLFHKKTYPISAADVSFGSVTVWSFRPLDNQLTQDIESYLYPWILAFRLRLVAVVGQGHLFSKRHFTGSEVDFYKRRLWYEIERGKRYNVFLTYYRTYLNLSVDVHEERIGDGARRVLRPFEPSICFLDQSRLDFIKIGQAAAAADRFVQDVEDALRRIACPIREIRKYTFPKDFFEFEEFLEKVSL